MTMWCRILSVSATALISEFLKWDGPSDTITDGNPYRLIHLRRARAVGAASVEGEGISSHSELKPSLITSRYLSPDSLSAYMNRWSM